jgi:hypothetical protein
MTETGAVKSPNLLRTKMVCEAIGGPGGDGAVIVNLRPTWDDKITEHQLATRGENPFVIRLSVPADTKNFFEIGTPVYLELHKF